jgi:predicted ArsR family transcriptional regulator
MSTAVQALLLIRLDARAGMFVGVAELAQHYGITPELVRRELQVLFDRHQVQCLLESDGTGPGQIVSAVSMVEVD